MPMTQRQNPELVIAGPYAVIRHPIYTGILLAILGSVVGVTLFWILPLILCTFYFIYSAKREEKLMLELFPAQYPAYKARTKMLLPLIF
jgi:protein-S-isoprenylcysteine O-methyltransferase Ste14